MTQITVILGKSAKQQVSTSASGGKFNFNKFIDACEVIYGSHAISRETTSAFKSIVTQALVDVVQGSELPKKFLNTAEGSSACSEFIHKLYDNYSDFLRKKGIQFRDGPEYDDMAFPVNKKLLSEAFQKAFGVKLSKIGFQNISAAFELDAKWVNKPYDEDMDD